VTLTQQPVKEVEVLRLAILNGIGNITDNDILRLDVRQTHGLGKTGRQYLG
jgi:hypothetical protein